MQRPTVKLAGRQPVPTIWPKYMTATRSDEVLDHRQIMGDEEIASGGGLGPGPTAPGALLPKLY